MGIESVVAQLESAGERLILIRLQMLNMGNRVLLLRRTGPVSYSDSHLQNVRGIEFGCDADWSAYSPQFVGLGLGVNFHEAYADGANGFSAEIQIGAESCIAYLKQTGDWDADGGLRLGINNRWGKALGAIDLMLDSKVRPRYASAPQ